MFSSAMSKGPVPDPVFVFHGFSGGATCLHFLKNENTGKWCLLCGSMDGVLSLFDLQSKRLIRSRKAGDNAVVSCGSCGAYIWVHVRNEGLTFYTDHLQSTIDSHFKTKHYGFCAADDFKTDNSDCVICLPSSHLRNSEDVPTAKLCRLTEDKLQRVVEIELDQFQNIKGDMKLSRGMPMVLKCCKLSAVDLILVGYENGAICCFDSGNGLQLSTFNLYTDAITAFDYDPQHSLGFAGSVTNTLKCFRLSEECAIEHIPDRDIVLPTSGVASVKIRADRKLLACGCWDGALRLYSAKSGKKLAVVNFHEKAISSLGFVPGPVNGRWFLSCASKDEKVSLWDFHSD